MGFFTETTSFPHNPGVQRSPSYVDDVYNLYYFETFNFLNVNLSLGLIFVWRGKESSAVEGLAGARLAAKLKNKMEEQVNDVKRPPLSCL